jgi:hypothetical protein
MDAATANSGTAKKNIFFIRVIKELSSDELVKFCLG